MKIRKSSLNFPFFSELSLRILAESLQASSVMFVLAKAERVNIQEADLFQFN